MDPLQTAGAIWAVVFFFVWGAGSLIGLVCYLDSDDIPWYAKPSWYLTVLLFYAIVVSAICWFLWIAVINPVVYLFRPM